ncbi:nucleolin 2-like isoform X2 [Magnolia sinica]|uniref:nucleolin 2-like isoform X2 n=1 Tax=Magnolia sinica TaxID=86752 RepID=UPI002657C0A4|nr:nucleolin 2-like isoform X2 [Magnolia sinica]
MPPKTTIKKKIVKTTTPKTTRRIASKTNSTETASPEATPNQKTTSPETTTTSTTTTTPKTSFLEPTTITPITISPETSPNIPKTTSLETTTTVETNTNPEETTVPKTTPSSGRKTTAPKKVTPKTTARKTPANPQITSKTTSTPTTASKITTNTNEIVTSPETITTPETAPAPKITVSPNTTSKTTASSRTTVAEAGTSPETTTTPETAPNPNAASEVTAGSKTTITPETTTVETTSTLKATSPENASKITKPKTIIKVTKKIVKRKRIIRKPVGIAPQLPNRKEEEAETNPNPNLSTSQSIETEILDLNNPTTAPAQFLPTAQNANPPDGPSVAENQILDDIMVENETEKGDLGAAQDDEMTVSERRRRRKTEIFIGGLDKDAKEEDIRKVFEKVGEVVEIRLMMNSQTGKNKGYAFLRYASAVDAKRAVTEFAKVEICGKRCGAAAVEGNDTIFLGNINKKWKKEDITKLLQEIGIDNIDTVTVMADPNDHNCNRGFAFLELETNKDAQNAYKKLQKKDVFGKDRNIKVSWAEPLNDPDEEEMLKVKSVYADGIPSTWDEDKVRKHFKKFGEIERVVLARNIQSARRKDFAFVNYKTRESALACIESFNKEELIDEDLKANVKVSLARPVQKGKQSKGGSTSSSKDYIKEKPKPVKRDITVSLPSNKGKYVRGVPGNIGVDKKSSTTHELIQVLREQAARGQGQTGFLRGSTSQDYQGYMYTLPGGKRPFSSLGDDMVYSDPRGYSRARLDGSFPVASSSTLSHGMTGTSLPSSYQRPGSGYTAGSLYGASDPSTTFQTRHGSAPYGSGHYPRY